VVAVNSRWIARIVALMILVIFFLLMAHLQSRLVRLQKAQPAPAATP
jgi:hypothetical protein